MISSNLSCGTLINGNFSYKLPQNGNHVNFSSNTNYYRKSKVNGLSLKFVLDGIETYKVNGKNNKVKAGEYMIINNDVDYEVII